jgi:hypothetical protein
MLPGIFSAKRKVSVVIAAKKGIFLFFPSVFQPYEQKAEQVARANAATGGSSVAIPASETKW